MKNSLDRAACLLMIAGIALGLSCADAKGRTDVGIEPACVLNPLQPGCDATVIQDVGCTNSYPFARCVGIETGAAPAVPCRADGSQPCVRLLPPPAIVAADALITEYSAPGGNYALAGGGAAMPKPWHLTGTYLFAWTSPHKNLVPVCHLVVNEGHIYSAEPAECEAVSDANPSAYQGIAFYAHPSRLCMGAAVTRLYAHGSYRFVADNATVSAMVASGWQNEGLAFCVSSAR